jgi:hypothetical protein
MATTTAGVPIAANANPVQHSRSFIDYPSNITRWRSHHPWGAQTVTHRTFQIKHCWLQEGMLKR